MPIVKCLPRKHITWNIISNEIHSRNQIEVTDDLCRWNCSQAVTTPRYTVLFSKTIVSYRLVEIFVRVLDEPQAVDAKF